MAKEQTEKLGREIAIVNLYESQNVPGFANMKTIVAKSIPGVQIFEEPANAVLVRVKDRPDFKICHVKSIVYK